MLAVILTTATVGKKQVSKEAQTKINKQIDKQIIKERKKYNERIDE